MIEPSDVLIDFPERSSKKLPTVRGWLQGWWLDSTVHQLPSPSSVFLLPSVMLIVYLENQGMRMTIDASNITVQVTGFYNIVSIFPYFENVYIYYIFLLIGLIKEMSLSLDVSNRTSLQLPPSGGCLLRQGVCLERCMKDTIHSAKSSHLEPIQK